MEDSVWENLKCIGLLYEPLSSEELGAHAKALYLCGLHLTSAGNGDDQVL